jgi:uncharacterized protein with ATP-grasp and redox domains
LLGTSKGKIFSQGIAITVGHMGNTIDFKFVFLSSKHFFLNCSSLIKKELKINDKNLTENNN